MADFSAIRCVFVPPQFRRSALTTHMHRLIARTEWRSVAGLITWKWRAVPQIARCGRRASANKPAVLTAEPAIWEHGCKRYKDPPREPFNELLGRILPDSSCQSQKCLCQPLLGALCGFLVKSLKVDEQVEPGCMLANHLRALR